MEAVIENELNCSVCSEMIVFVRIDNLTWKKTQFVINSCYVGRFIELHAYILPLLHKYVEKEQDGMPDLSHADSIRRA